MGVPGRLFSRAGHWIQNPANEPLRKGRRSGRVSYQLVVGVCRIYDGFLRLTRIMTKPIQYLSADPVLHIE